MNFMKKILVQTNSTTNQQTSSSSNQQNTNQIQLNNESNQQPNQKANQQIENKSSSKGQESFRQQIELDKQLEKQRILREYRQSSTAKSQESSNQLEFSTVNNDFNIKTKTRGLSLTCDQLIKHNTQDIGLTLLNKLFLNIKTEHNNSIKQYGVKGPTKYDQLGIQRKLELEKNIYRLLPLFMKTFNCSINETMPEMKISNSMQSFIGSSGVIANRNEKSIKNTDLFDQFHDLPCFVQIISKLMVSEIRKRASQKTTQEASQAVVKFLELSSNNKQKLDPLEEDENNCGWILLSTLNFLVCNCSSNIIPVMANASLPSTLVKCLYLFFDLPEIESNLEDDKNLPSTYKNTYNSQMTSSISLSKITLDDIQSDLDRRLLLKKVFTQLLSRLSVHQSTIEDLTKKDDLERLFNAITNWCPNRWNTIWRETAAEVIINMIKYKYMNIEYLHEKQCIPTCIENMSKLYDLNKATIKEVCEMWCTLLSFFIEIMNCNQAQCDQSSDDNQVYSKQYLSALLIDFKQANGYNLLLNFIIKLECEFINKQDEECSKLMHKLISLIVLFSKVGTSELKMKPISVNQLFIMDGFTLPKSTIRNCVRNSNAFNIFFNLWPNAKSKELQDYLLTALITIYRSDKANYFVLDSQNTLAQLSENLFLKPINVQESYFTILEFIIFELRYIPCKELIGIEILLKQNYSTECNILYLKSLLSIVKFNSLFRDVYREVGIFDVLTQLFKNKMERILNGDLTTIDNKEFILKEQIQLVDLLIEIIQNTLIGPNSSNCKLFDEIQGTKLIYKILCSIDRFKTNEQKSITKQIKKSSFLIIQQLIGYNLGEERLTIILDVLHAASDYTTELELNLTSRANKRKSKRSKEQIANEDELKKELIDYVNKLNAIDKFKIKIRLLKLLFNILKDSHRCRAMFRKTGGFIYIISILVSMEGYFRKDGKLPENIEQVGYKKVLNLLKLIFSVLTVAMRFEPANAKFIHNEIGSNSLSDSLRLLGCFSQELYLQDDLEELTKEQTKLSKLTGDEKNELYEQYIFEDYFQIDNNKPWSNEQIICLLIKLMYEMALDQIEKNKTLVFQDKHKVGTYQTNRSTSSRSRPCSVAASSRHSSCSLTIDYYSDCYINNTNLIIHPTVIVSIFQLIPSIGSISLRKFVLNNLINSLLEIERNQQVLCSVGFLNELLSRRFNYALINEHHSLHSSLQKIFIQLSSQQINSHNLRNYIRLNRPFNSILYEEMQVQQKRKQQLCKLSSSCYNFNSSIVDRLKTSSPIPLITIKTLSLITIKNYRQEANRINFAAINASTNQQQQQHQQISNQELIEKVIFHQPPFIEFDLNQEGFASIFLPSIAPVNINANTNNSMNFLNQNLLTNAILNTTSDNQQNHPQLNGGIGVGERLFPPQNLTYLTWFCIDQFPGCQNNSSSPTSNPESCSPSPTPYSGTNQHSSNKDLLTKDVNNIRLLTIVRSLKNGKEFCCLQIQISPKDKCLIVSTQEIPFTEQTDILLNQDATAKIFYPNLFTQGKWHHLAVVLSRALLKNSTCSIYLDGQFIANQKLHYISSSVGSSGMLNNLNNSQSNACYVNAYIGVPTKLRCRVNLVWRQGCCYLIEDNLTQNWISYIYNLGPSYTGSFQHQQQYSQPSNLSASTSSTNQTQPQSPANLNVLNQINSIPEERIMFGLNAKANSSMTLAKLKRVYSKLDCKQLADQLSLSIHENATPITVLHNSSGHLIGPARSLGGFLTGYVGARYFIPKSITSTISEIGGCVLLLGIISNSNQEDLFLNSIKLFVVMLNSGNRKLQEEMKQINGYQILVALLRKKKNFLNSDIFNGIVHLTCELEDQENLNAFLQSRDTFGKLNNNLITIKEKTAFKELIIEHLDLWWQDELILKALLDLFNGLLDNQRYRHLNLKKLRELGLLNKMLFCLWNFKTQTKDPHLMNLTRKILFNLLNQTKRTGDILHFGQFLCIYLQINEKVSTNNEQIEMRNSLLKIIMHLLTKNNQQINAMMQEKFIDTLGFDWFLLFIRNPNLNKETIILGLVNLMILISNPSLYTKFREAVSNGGWLRHTRTAEGLVTCNFSKEDELLSINDVKMLGMNVINLGQAIENNLTNLNNLTLENLNESITSNILDRDDRVCNEQLNKAAEIINLSGLKKIETNLFLIPGFQQLDWLLLDHLYEPRIYLILFQCLLGEYQQFSSNILETIENFETLTNEQLKQCLNLIESKVFNNKTQQQPQNQQSPFFVSDISISISNLINKLLENRLKKKFMNFEDKEDENEKSKKENEKLTEQELANFESDYPLILIQTLVIIYKTRKEFQNYCQNTPDFIFNLSQLLITKSIEYKKIDNLEEVISKDDFLVEFRTSTINFIKLIIVDSLICCNKSINRTQLIIMEQFLDTFQHCKATQKEILNKLITHLNEIVEAQAEFQNFISIHIPSQTPRPVKTNFALNNIVAFISVLADKTWAESYTNESTEIFDFCLNYLSKIDLLSLEAPSNARIMHSEELNRLFKSTNRIILYLLSRPIIGMAEKMALIEFLNKIILNKKILFSQFNNDATFFICLTYCLMQFIDQQHITLCSAKKTKSTWNVINDNLNSINQNVSIDEGDENDHNPNINTSKLIQQQTHFNEDEGALLIVSNAKKIWEDLFLLRKHLLEETFRIKLTNSNASFGLNSDIADLKKIKPNIYDNCLKAWNNFIENEQQIRILKAKCKQNLMQSKSLSSNLQNSSNLDSSNQFTLNNFAAVGERLTNINKLSKVVGSGAGLMSKLVINTVSSTMKKDSFKSSSSSISVEQQTGQNKQLAIPVWRLMDKNQVIKLTELHLTLIMETVQFNYKNKIQKNQHLNKYVLEDWSALEFEILLRERAIFECPSFDCKKFNKWMLDTMTEGPNRMRKKMIRNDMFYIHYPPPKEIDSPKNLKQIKYKQPISWDSIEMHKRGLYQFSRNTSMTSLENLNSSDEDSYLQSISMITSNMVNLSKEQKNLNKSMDSDEHSFDEQKEDNQPQKEPLSNKPSAMGNEPALNSTELEQLESQSLARLLEEGEKISSIYKCAQVLGLDAAEGLMLFGKEHFYLISGFTILKNNEIRDLDTLPENLKDPIVPDCNTPTTAQIEKRKLTNSQSTSGASSTNLLNTNKLITKKICMKFAYEDIKEVHKRRYLLQPISLEIFSIDGRNSLLVFTRKQRNKIYTKLLSLASNINDNAQESLAGQRKNVNIESGSNLLTNFFSEQSVMERWIKGEISNFTYLICLNNLAGRTYNDFAQYPIFPWILADYKSETLNLNDKATFRDLSKPMGAQTENRLQQFLARYKDFDCIHEIPPYHYGTFYSSAMIVASYLVRMEPFTQCFLNLQGGHFDLADRMFHSIEESWLSASQNNMADIKELIPEFFYLPEFLVNSNRFDLGVKQNGVQLNDVLLPPWAKGDPKEFIRLNRLALESDYVSQHLHAWIDLVFGYKQTGQAAIDNVNVFHHLFYEGNVDINTIDDPLKKKAIIGYINNFGQIPKQLFKKPHPVKKTFAPSATSIANTNTFFGSNMQINQINSANSLATPPLTSSSINNQTQQLSTPNSNSNSIPLTPLFSSMLGGNSSANALSNQQSCSSNDRLIMHNLLNLVQTNHTIKELRGVVGQIIQQEKNILAVEQNKVLIPPNFNKYIAYGYADRSIRIGNYESDRALSIFESDLLPCTDEVLCAAVASSRIMITGGTNSVVSVWRLRNKLTKIELLQNLYAHTEPITCLAASSAYGILVSGSRDRTCVIWDLNKLTFVRQLGAESYSEQNEEMKERLRSALINQNKSDNFSKLIKTDSESGEQLKSEYKAIKDPLQNQSANIFQAPISAICINDLSGDIATCSGSQIFVWTINGDLLACVDIFNYQYSNIHNENRILSMLNAPSNVQILCCTFSLYKEYDENNIFVVGCSDGTIRIYTIKYIQIPLNDNELQSNKLNSKDSNTDKESVGELIDKVNKLTNKSEEESSITPSNKANKKLVRSEECEANDLNEDCIMVVNKDEMVRRMSLITVQAESQVQDESSDEEEQQQKKNDDQQADNKIEIPVTKINDQESNIESNNKTERKSLKRKGPKCPLRITTTNLIDVDNKQKEFNDQILRPGFKWSRQLILENELSLVDKVAISSITISKDNRTLFVGDTKGRLSSFIVSNISNTPQSQSPKMSKLADELNLPNCKQCSNEFKDELNNQVQCLNCSKYVCKNCYKFFKLTLNHQYKVCLECYGLLSNRK